MGTASRTVGGGPANSGRDVMELEVEEDPGAPSCELPHQLRPMGGESLKAQLAPPGDAAQRPGRGGDPLAVTAVESDTQNLLGIHLTSRGCCRRKVYAIRTRYYAGQ